MARMLGVYNFFPRESFVRLSLCKAISMVRSLKHLRARLFKDTSSYHRRSRWQVHQKMDNALSQSQSSDVSRMVRGI